MGAAAASGESLVEVGNSALFDASASTDGLSYTTDGSGFNQKIFTLSTWFYLGSDTSSIGGVGWPIFASDHGTANSETTWWKVRINTNGTLVISNWDDVTTTQVFRDIGWYNLVIGADTTQSTAADRYKVYVNGERITSFSSTSYPSQNIDLAWGEPSEDHWIGNYDNANYAYNGYLAETVFKSGSQLGPESFGEFDSTETFWTPLSSTAILAGSPTFYLDNSTNPQTDASGNGINWTNNGSIATSTHTPTNIEFLMSPINVTDGSDNPVLSNGNRTYTASSASAQTRMGGNIPFPSSGKWLQGVSLSDKDNGKAFAVWTDRTDGDGFPNFGGFLGWHLTTVMNGYNSSGSAPFSLESNFTTSDQFWIAVDIDNSKVWLGFYDDSANTITWYAADGGTDGNPATGDNPFESIDCSGAVFAGAAQNSKAFTLVKEADCPFTIPTGYSFLSTTNLAANITRTSDVLSDHFQAQIVAHDGSSTSFTLNWNPDTYQTMYKIKRRDGSTEKWFWINTKSGITKYKDSTAALAATTDSNVISQSGTTVTLGSTLASASYLVECYRFDTTDSTPANAGTIATTVSVNTVMNWSLAFYTGTGANGTLGHGLSSAPGHIEWWNMDANTNVQAYWEGMGGTKVDLWNDTAPSSTSSSYLNNTAPTSTVTSIGSGSRANGSGNAICMLSFGNSQFVKSNVQYEGNGNTNGTFVPVISSEGILIQPAYLISHNIDATAERPTMNTTTGPTNPNEAALYTGDTAVEVSSLDTDIVTGGFKPRVTSVNINASNTYNAVVIGTQIIDVDGRIITGR